MRDVTQEKNQDLSCKIEDNSVRVELINRDGLSTNYLNEMRFHRDRTGIGSARLLKDRQDVPTALNKFVIENWLKENTKTASSVHVNYVLNLWNTLPDAEERILIDPCVRQKLQELFSRTNLTFKTFLKTYRGSAPKSFRANEIDCWISGDAKTAIKKHLDFTINQLESLVGSRNNLIKITPEMRNDLLAEKMRTGLSPKALLEKQDDIPPGLIKSWVAGWLSGKIDSAESSHIEYVLAKWKSLPKSGWYSRPADEKLSHDKMPRIRKSEPDMVELTAETRDILRFKFQNSGITLSSFLRRFSPVPAGLTQNTISRWMTGQAKTARRSQLEFVLKCLDRLSPIGG